jgi:DNA-binding transcriptional regulator YiaG
MASKILAIAESWLSSFCSSSVSFTASSRRVARSSQERMAEFLGVDESSVSGWERREHRPTQKRRQMITQVFGNEAQDCP